MKVKVQTTRLYTLGNYKNITMSVEIEKELPEGVDVDAYVKNTLAQQTALVDLAQIEYVCNRKHMEELGNTEKAIAYLEELKSNAEQILTDIVS